jgi:hypothetical protein
MAARLAPVPAGATGGLSTADGSRRSDRRPVRPAVGSAQASGWISGPAGRLAGAAAVSHQIGGSALVFTRARRRQPGLGVRVVGQPASIVPIIERSRRAEHFDLER